MAKTEERDHIDRWMEEAWLEDIPLLDLEVEGIVDRMNGLNRRLRKRLNAVPSGRRGLRSGVRRDRWRRGLSFRAAR